VASGGGKALQMPAKFPVVLKEKEVAISGLKGYISLRRIRAWPVGTPDGLRTILRLRRGP